MRTRCRSDTSNSGWPEPPELISVPISTFAGGDDAVKGRGDRLERLHGLELPDIGLVGVDDGLLCRGVGGGLVRKLLGHDLLLHAGCCCGWR